MHAIAEQAASDPAALKAAPVTTPVGRLDEAGAARRPDLAYRHPPARRRERADRL